MQKLVSLSAVPVWKILTGIRRMSHITNKIDPIQEAALAETCILVNEQDKAIGKASKYECHRVDANGNIPLHRAFSVFIFNSKNELLLQKRSNTKVTFPGFVTNSCCSHPLYDFEEEKEEKATMGIRIAAQRRLQHELGIPLHEIGVDSFQYLTRVHYKFTGDDGVWGEHEIDYILFLHKDVTLNPNLEEVSEVCYVSQREFDLYFKNLDSPITPWFNLIVKNRLHLWWGNLEGLRKFEDHQTINTFNTVA